jgi:hypothetical protein
VSLNRVGPRVVTSGPARGFESSQAWPNDTCAANTHCSAQLQPPDRNPGVKRGQDDRVSQRDAEAVIRVFLPQLQWARALRGVVVTPRSPQCDGPRHHQPGLNEPWLFDARGLPRCCGLTRDLDPKHLPRMSRVFRSRPSPRQRGSRSAI